MLRVMSSSHGTIEAFINCIRVLVVIVTIGGCRGPLVHALPSGTVMSHVCGNTTTEGSLRGRGVRARRARRLVRRIASGR